MPECEHPEAAARWDGCAQPNEDHWGCGDCGAPLGFRPDLDRSQTLSKVYGLQLDFHSAKLIYISNGTMGEVISENVAARCHKENLFDQLSILRFILTDPNMSDGTFWQNRATRWLMGGEPIRSEQEAIPF